MGEPHWSSYVGMVTGVIGTLAGITGAVLGIISYRRTSAIKQLDLRLELRKAANKLDSDLRALGDLLPLANKSRERVSAAKGVRNSGAMEAWAKAFSDDSATLTVLLDAAPAYRNEFLRLDLGALESKLTEIHQLQLQADQLDAKYRASLAQDDADRAFLRDQAHRRAEGLRGK